MIISGITKAEIDSALTITNKLFGGNIIINNYSCINAKGTRHRVTLRVKDSSGPGHRLGFVRTSKGNRRKLVSLCWHGYGYFIENVFSIVNDPDKVKVSNGLTGKMDTWDTWYWHDRQIGSMMDPIMYSDACDCDR